MTTLPKIGLSLLAWKSLTTLENTLQALKNLPPDLFSDKVIFFQEMSEDDQALAQKYGYRAEGNEENKGIREGIKQAVIRCRAEIVLFLECDCFLIEDDVSAVVQIESAAKEVARGNLSVVRMRHIQQPGLDYDGVRKYSRYWPLLNHESIIESFFRTLRRLLRPFKARRLLGQAVMARPDAAEIFPRWINRLSPSLYRISSTVIPWTNQAILVDKVWLLHTLMPFAEANPTSRNVNGFPDLERELNCRWWRQLDFNVGQSIPGLFTHQRLDRPENDEKNVS